MSTQRKTVNAQSSRHSQQQTIKTVENYSYNIRDRIGKGFSSSVYKGQNTDNKNQVAIKVIDLRKLQKDAMHELLQSQITIIKTLNHLNILKCENVLITVNNCYIVTQICKGGDLASVIKKKGRLRGLEALKVMIDIARGYTYLQGLHIIHRDLKPANILMHQGVAKIADFGFARFQQKARKQKYNVGSPLYMSPEALNHNIYSKQNDIWSLGILFYQILQGRPPYSPKNQKQLKSIFKKKQQIIFRIAIRDQLQTMIKRCLIFQRQNRITSKQILQILQNIMEEMSHAQVGKGQFVYRQTLTRRPNCSSHSVLPNLMPGPINANHVNSTNNLIPLRSQSTKNNDENKQKQRFIPPLPPQRNRQNPAVKLQQINNQPHVLNLTTKNQNQIYDNQECNSGTLKFIQQKLSHNKSSIQLHSYSNNQIFKTQNSEQQSKIISNEQQSTCQAPDFRKLSQQQTQSQYSQFQLREKSVSYTQIRQKTVQHQQQKIISTINQCSNQVNPSSANDDICERRQTIMNQIYFQTQIVNTKNKEDPQKQQNLINLQKSEQQNGYNFHLNLNINLNTPILSKNYSTNNFDVTQSKQTCTNEIMNFPANEKKQSSNIIQRNQRIYSTHQVNKPLPCNSNAPKRSTLDQQIRSVRTTSEYQSRKNSQLNSIEQASRHNHRLLKSIINFTRFTFKLFPKIDKIVNVDNWVKQRIQVQMLSILSFTIQTLSQALKNQFQGVKFGIKKFYKFAETRCYSKTVLVVDQYYARYTSFIKKKEAKIINPSCPEKLPIFNEFSQFGQCAERIARVMKLFSIIYPDDCAPLQEYQHDHNIALDFLTSLVILLKILSDNTLQKFAELSSIEEIVDNKPSKLGPAQLQCLEQRMDLLFQTMEYVQI